MCQTRASSSGEATRDCTATRRADGTLSGSSVSDVRPGHGRRHAGEERRGGYRLSLHRPHAQRLVLGMEPPAVSLRCKGWRCSCLATTRVRMTISVSRIASQRKRAGRYPRLARPPPGLQIEHPDVGVGGFTATPQGATAEDLRGNATRAVAGLEALAGESTQLQRHAEGHCRTSQSAGAAR
eukprot:936999-Rhodomonas_salina.3